MRVRDLPTAHRILLLLLATVFAPVAFVAAQDSKDKSASKSKSQAAIEPKTAVFAAGCFWCVETDFERAPGVLDIVAGYTGGRTKKPSYETYASGGHREAVLITYDPSQITYAGLVEFLLKHSNPIDRGGAFIDRGTNYAPAIYYADDEEKKVAEEVIKKIDALKVFKAAINLPVVKRGVFYPAEEYHQDYHHNNPGAYGEYRATCGRDAFITKIWGANADFLSLPGAFPEEEEQKEPSAKELALYEEWKTFNKPAAAALKKKLTKIQFQVTQEKATEKPFENPLAGERAPGIYVDVVSGEPLFSSRDKLDVKDGWPSFSQPIIPGAARAHKVGTKKATYYEVHSRFADSYLGRLLTSPANSRDQAEEKRFSINAAALRFVPLEKMAAEGYGAFEPIVTASSEQADPVSK